MNNSLGVLCLWCSNCMSGSISGQRHEIEVRFSASRLTQPVKMNTSNNILRYNGRLERSAGHTHFLYAGWLKAGNLSCFTLMLLRRWKKEPSLLCSYCYTPCHQGYSLEVSHNKNKYYNSVRIQAFKFV